MPKVFLAREIEEEEVEVTVVRREQQAEKARRLALQERATRPVKPDGKRQKRNRPWR